MTESVDDAMAPYPYEAVPCGVETPRAKVTVEIVDGKVCIDRSPELSEPKLVPMSMTNMDSEQAKALAAALWKVAKKAS